MFRRNIVMGICTFFLLRPSPSFHLFPLLRLPLSHNLTKINDVVNDDDGGGQCILTNRETMLSNTPLDLILILSPSELHVPQALLCLKYKKHIFIEKPLANTLSEVDELEKARIESGMIVFVGYMRRYAAAVRLVKQRLEGKGIRYVRVRELIGSVSPCSSPLLLTLPLHNRLTDWVSETLSPVSSEIGVLTYRMNISPPNQRLTHSTTPPQLLPHLRP